MKLPKSLNPSPIIESIVEFRFSTNLHHSAVFGVIYNSLKDDYPNVLELPIMQLPEQIRKNDNTLKSKPYFMIHSDDGIKVQIGPSIISISSPKKYIGWEKLHEIITKIITSIKQLDIIDNFTRIAIRYIDFFEIDIFEKIKLGISWDNTAIKDNNKYIRTEINQDDHIHILQISNNALSDTKKGSIIDIDTVIENNEIDFEHLDDYLNVLHESSKSLFFDLLKDEFIETLNPSYE